MSYQKPALLEAVGKVRQGKERNFVQSVEVLISLRDINLKDPSQRFNIESLLPHAIKKEIKIVLFADGDLAVRGKNEGLTVISSDKFDQLVKNPKDGKKLADDHDFFLAERQYMAKVGRFLGKILGPRGKMPKPVAPNVNINDLKENYFRTIRLRLRENPCLNARIGTLSNSDEELADNIISCLATVTGKLPRGAQHIKKVYMKTTMGSSVLIE
ncbi:MAG: 50S ribosomal protein L1 [Candidatus Heimdallarchaeota archaeon LC_3]|uniref:Putative 50S ribosomal protein L1 n=2 Tax=unclassified sequences TaxID=12908 RepID=A0A0F6PXE5_9ZZZZ|nr:putative 50S ribosomal protein L1 [uncultured organism]OLS19514.1 MAG: 50S ribosomal protein L1 [Candidatus Heimdallarchaeota archaeon LC_3]